jgi:predicted transcriptional regulator
MATYREKLELANGFSWDEILAPGFFSKVSEETNARGSVKTIWEAPDGKQFVDINNSEHLFVAVDGEPVLVPEPTSKLDALRLFHFEGDAAMAGLFLESGKPLSRTALDDIAEEQTAERQERLRRLSPLARYRIDRGFQVRVDNTRLNQEASEEAKRQIQEAKFSLEKRTPKATLLSDFLELELEKERFLVDGLIPYNSTSTLVAARKSGKSTFVYNIIHSLVTGSPLLGCFETKKLKERIGYVNYELTETQAQDWFKRSPIGKTGQVAIWNLRGLPNPFRSVEALEEFAAEVKELNIRVLILDPFSSAFRGDSQSNDEVKEFFLMTDAFKEASGVKELIIPIHAGWDTTRVRGASTLDDHPDAILHLENSSDGVRTFHAFGRDVEVLPGELDFDKATLLLTYKGATTPEVKQDKFIKVILDLLKTKTEVSATTLREEVVGSNYQIEKARDAAVDKGLIAVRQVGNSKKYSLTQEGLAYSPIIAPGASAGSGEVVSPPIYRGDTTTTPAREECDCGKKFSKPTPLLGLSVEVCWDCFSVGKVTGELVGFEVESISQDFDEEVGF